MGSKFRGSRGSSVAPPTGSGSRHTALHGIQNTVFHLSISLVKQSFASSFPFYLSTLCWACCTGQAIDKTEIYMDTSRQAIETKEERESGGGGGGREKGGGRDDRKGKEVEEEEREKGGREWKEERGIGGRKGVGEKWWKEEMKRAWREREGERESDGERERENGESGRKRGG